MAGGPRHSLVDPRLGTRRVPIVSTGHPPRVTTPGGPMTAALESIITELSEADRQERIELLIDFAKNLPPLPERLAAHKDASHRVEECQSPVYLFVELDGERVALHADAPIEAPTVRGFVSLLIEGLSGAT